MKTIAQQFLAAPKKTLASALALALVVSASASAYQCRDLFSPSVSAASFSRIQSDMMQFALLGFNRGATQKDQLLEIAESVRLKNLARLDEVLETLPIRQLDPDGLRGRTLHPDQPPVFRAHEVFGSRSLPPFIIGIQDFPEGQGWAAHSYLIVNGKRFDGEYMGMNSREPHGVSTVHRGLLFVFDGIPAKELEKLEQKLETNPNIRDLNCYSSIVRFLEEHSSVNLNRDNRLLPLAPSEIIMHLLLGRLRNGDTGLSYRVVSTTKRNLKDLFTDVIEDERRRLNEIIPSGIDAQSINDGLLSGTSYHTFFGWP